MNRALRYHVLKPILARREHAIQALLAHPDVKSQTRYLALAEGDKPVRVLSQRGRLLLELEDLSETRTRMKRELKIRRRK